MGIEARLATFQDKYATLQTLSQNGEAFFTTRRAAIVGQIDRFINELKATGDSHLSQVEELRNKISSFEFSQIGKNSNACVGKVHSSAQPVVFPQTVPSSPAPQSTMQQDYARATVEQAVKTSTPIAISTNQKKGVAIQNFSVGTRKNVPIEIGQDVKTYKDVKELLAKQLNMKPGDFKLYARGVQLLNDTDDFKYTTDSIRVRIINSEQSQGTDLSTQEMGLPKQEILLNTPYINKDLDAYRGDFSIAVRTSYGSPPLSIKENIPMEKLKFMVAEKLGISVEDAGRMQILKNGRIVPYNTTLDKLGLKPGDSLSMSIPS